MIDRDATAADLSAIDGLYRDSFVATFGHLYHPHDLAAFLADVTLDRWAEELATPDYAFRVIEDAEGIAGYAKTSPLRLPADTRAAARELRQLYVAERAKGSGAAQTLMRWTIDSARAGGAEELWLSVYVDNHRARRFYARHGFDDMAPYIFMVGTHADEDRLMRLKL